MRYSVRSLTRSVKKNPKLVGLIALLALVVIVPLTVIVLQQRQETRQHASTVPLVCSTNPTDSVLIIDVSGSMTGTVSSTDSTPRINAAKTAAKAFVDIISGDSNNRVALVTFDKTGHLISGFTNNFAGVKSLIDGISTTQGTCTECGVLTANSEIAAHGRSGIKKVALLLTDGKADWVQGGTTNASSSQAESAAISAVQQGINQSQTIFYTIGLGADVDATFLQQIASMAGGTYNFAPTASQLTTIYQQISQVIGKGS